MPYCEWIELPDGTKAIVRFGGKRPSSKCSCGQAATIQCDYPVGQKTCDAWLCRRCAVPVGENRDWCPAHHRQGLP